MSLAKLFININHESLTSLENLCHVRCINGKLSVQIASQNLYEGLFNINNILSKIYLIGKMISIDMISDPALLTVQSTA